MYLCTTRNSSNVQGASCGFWRCKGEPQAQPLPPRLVTTRRSPLLTSRAAIVWELDGAALLFHSLYPAGAIAKPPWSTIMQRGPKHRRRSVIASCSRRVSFDHGICQMTVELCAHAVIRPAGRLSLQRSTTAAASGEISHSQQTGCEEDQKAGSAAPVQWDRSCICGYQPRNTTNNRAFD